MNRSVYIALAVIVIAYLGVCVAMFVYQRSLLYFPQPRMVSAPQSTMTLPVDGAVVVVTVRPHAGPKALLYFGGNGEDVSANLETFAKAFPDHALYLLHYRSYGGSTGSPTEKANIRDATALFQKVRVEHPDVSLVGRSLGTGVAVHLASELPASRLILITPYDSIEEIAAAQYPYLPVRLLMLDTYNSGMYAPNIRIPTTIIEAENDETIPHASTEKLLARFGKGVASMTVIRGVGHNDIGTNGEYLKTMQAALQ